MTLAKVWKIDWRAGSKTEDRLLRSLLQQNRQWRRDEEVLKELVGQDLLIDWVWGWVGEKSQEMNAEI